MKFAKFYGHFAAAYGTCWLVLLLAALVSQSHINAGAFGMFGFPVIALIYAIVRSVSATTGALDEELALLRRRLAELERQTGSGGQPQP